MLYSLKRSARALNTGVLSAYFLSVFRTFIGGRTRSGTTYAYAELFLTGQCCYIAATPPRQRLPYLGDGVRKPGLQRLEPASGPRTALPAPLGGKAGRSGAGTPPRQGQQSIVPASPSGAVLS